MLFFLLLIQCNCSEWFWRPDQFMPIWRRHIQALSNFTMDWSSVWSLDYSIWCLEFWHSLLWYLFWNRLCCVWFKFRQPVLGSHAAKAVAFLLLVFMVSLKFKVRWTISWNITLYALVSVLQPKFRSGVHLQKSGLILIWQLFWCLSIVQ